MIASENWQFFIPSQVQSCLNQIVRAGNKRAVSPRQVKTNIAERKTFETVAGKQIISRQMLSSNLSVTTSQSTFYLPFAINRKELRIPNFAIIKNSNSGQFFGKKSLNATLNFQVFSQVRRCLFKIKQKIVEKSIFL